ncbi:MAG: hypothetical protein GEU26_17430 [Nitrososphaeraceae archaeon]|nr:hypothetical protein [Nitrososphaeraceae archaeon]
MNKYIIGVYFRSKEQVESIKNDPEQLILDNLKNAYPRAKTATSVWEDLKEDTGFVPSTIYKGIENLERRHFVRKLSRHQKRDAALREDREPDNRPQFYISEQADNTMHLLSTHTDPNKRLPEYWLAPGYVEYNEEFSKEWNDLLSNRSIEDLLHTISKQVLQFLRFILESNEIRKIGSSAGRSSMHCMNCGVDHETRNFLRAISLKILDHIEISPDYIRFLRDNNILNNLGYEIYEEASKYNTQLLKSSSSKETAAKEKKVLSSIVLRIVAVGEGMRADTTGFLALSSDGSYIIGEIDNSLKSKDMKEDTLVEYTGSSQIFSGSTTIEVVKDSMSILHEDDGSIPTRAAIPITSISSIKGDTEYYRVSAEVVRKKEMNYPSREYGNIVIKDSTGEIEYATGAGDTYRKLKVGDRIDLIGICHLVDNGFFFHGPRSIETIRLIE